MRNARQHVEDLVEGDGLTQAAQLVGTSTCVTSASFASGPQPWHERAASAARESLRVRQRESCPSAARGGRSTSSAGAAVSCVAAPPDDTGALGGRGGCRGRLAVRASVSRKPGAIKTDGVVEQRQASRSEPSAAPHPVGQRRRLFEGDLLLGQDCSERGARASGAIRRIVKRCTRERTVAGCRADRSGKHEHHVRGRLLQRREQRVERRLGELMDLVDDVEIVAPAGRRELTFSRSVRIHRCRGWRRPSISIHVQKMPESRHTVARPERSAEPLRSGQSSDLATQARVGVLTTPVHTQGPATR